jgi:cytochrome b involved in lipid metabolism
MKKSTVSKLIFLLIAGALVVILTAISYSYKNGDKDDDDYDDYKVTQVRDIKSTTPLKSYSIVEVSKHKTPADCWTSVNGNVYDLTKWIAEHPGGEQPILYMCGIDGSVAFNGQHGGQSRPEKVLDAYLIGTLK